MKVTLFVGDREVAEDPPRGHVERREVDHRPVLGILELNPDRSVGGRWLGRLLPTQRLDAGLLVQGEHHIPGAQRLAFPDPMVEVQNAGGFGAEPRARGFFQYWLRQGRRWAFCSQRCRVERLGAGRSSLVTSRASSVKEKRERSAPSREGSSQARAVARARSSSE